MGGMGTGPDGRITTNTGRAQNGPVGALSTIECATIAARYARLNNRQRFIALTQEANRYNVSFYPFDPRGLAGFDRNVGDRDERTVADRGEWYNKESGTLPGTMMGDDHAQRAARLVAIARRQHRRARGHQHQRPEARRRGAYRARPVVLLPLACSANETLDGAGDDQGPCQAPRRRTCAPARAIARCAPRTWPPSPRRRAPTPPAARATPPPPPRARLLAAALGRSRYSRRTAVAQPGGLLLPRRPRVRRPDGRVWVTATSIRQHCVTGRWRRAARSP